MKPTSLANKPLKGSMREHGATEPLILGGMHNAEERHDGGSQIRVAAVQIKGEKRIRYYSSRVL